MRTRLLAVTAAAVASLVLAGCADDATTGADAPEPTHTISTLTPIAMPSIGPPPGEIVADLRQSSRDAALGRFEVWIGNGLGKAITPTDIEYVDARFRTPIPGDRLRENPSGSERGYPLYLPDRPACDADPVGSGTVTMTYGGKTVTLDVDDEADVVQRFVTTRCFELAVDAVASLSFADEVPTDHDGEGSIGRLVLVATPSGRAGAGSLTIDSVGGTPLLTPNGQSVWRPDLRVTSTGEEQRVELPMIPARCDDHVFMESGGATAFRIHLHLDGEPGDLVVRMSAAGASNAIGFARDSCGLG